MIKPGANLDASAQKKVEKIVQQGVDGDSSDHENVKDKKKRKKRRLDIKAFERTQKFFAESKHAAAGRHLKGGGGSRKQAGSPLKRSVSLLR